MLIHISWHRVVAIFKFRIVKIFWWKKTISPCRYQLNSLDISIVNTQLKFPVLGQFEQIWNILQFIYLFFSSLVLTGSISNHPHVIPIEAYVWQYMYTHIHFEWMILTWWFTLHSSICNYCILEFWVGFYRPIPFIVSSVGSSRIVKIPELDDLFLIPNL